jgi:sugar O-acyltransferase (sialic acid O-acetyltransferase NeuD family)
MKEKLLLAGGGGHCKSCIDVILEEGRFEIAGIVESSGFPDAERGREVMGYPVIGTDDDLPELVKLYPDFLITIGQIAGAEARIKLFERITELGGHFPVIVSPYAHVSRSAVVGLGTIVMHHAVVNAEARIGKNCIINTGALVEHESVTGDHCHISTYAILNGRCTVGSRTFIGSRAVLANDVAIPHDTLVSAGSVVLKTLTEPGTYIGNPLRRIR